MAAMAAEEHIRRWSSIGDDVPAWIERQRAESRGPSRAICLAGPAVRAIMTLAAATTQLRKVVLDIELGNIASVRLARRLGAERREPEHIKAGRDGVPRALAVFVLPVPRP